jgi:hypothetical protein
MKWGADMLTRAILAFSIGLLCAGGVATQSAFGIQQSAYIAPGFGGDGDTRISRLAQRP